MMIAFGPHIVFRNVLHGSQCFTKLESSIIRLALPYSVCCRTPHSLLYGLASHHFLLSPAQPPQALAIALPSSPVPAATLSSLSLATLAFFWFLPCSWAPSHLSMTHRLYGKAAGVSSSRIAFSSFHTCLICVLFRTHLQGQCLREATPHIHMD